MIEGNTIGLIREAAAARIPVQFTPSDVDAALDWNGTFLPKHRVGNPENTALFVQVSRGL
jgi:hypothetical protein